MKISPDDEHWRSIAAHANAYLSDGGSPWAVRLQLAALVGAAGVAESMDVN
jgi:hypothetical protein